MSFSQVLEAAIAGTLRQQPPAMLPADEISAENRLLRSASYEGLRRLAGRPLEWSMGTGPVAPAAPETQPEIPPPTTRRLPELLDDRPELLPEWLRLVTERGLRIPHVSLPDLLEYARTEDDEVRDLIVAAGGQRLPWLAKLNPDWQFAACSDPEASFTSGGHDERLRALRTLRRLNAARGRELLQDAWPAEHGDSRAAFLDALSIGLSAEDENLLHTAIGDSRKQVRETALRLIRRIPGSAFSFRFAARARRIVTLETAPTGALGLQIHEPVEPAPDWLADGIDPRPPKGIGMTAWLVQQVIALTPPSIWPTSLIDALQHTDWQRPLAAGLGQAAQAYAHAEWCTMLLILRARTNERSESLPLDAAALFAALDPDRAEAVLRQLLELGSSAIKGLPEARHDLWSPDFSRFLVRQLPRLIDKWQYQALPLLQAAPSRLDPCVLPELERLLRADLDLGWARPWLNRVVETVDYRHAMRSELS